jgi:CheY-like chemotaxis protein
MARMLALLGYESVSAKSIADVEALDGCDYHLVLTDYSLPDGDATHLVSRVRQHHSVPVVLLTAYSVIDLPQEARDCFDAILTKPVEMEDLKRVLAQFLEPSRAQQS